MPTWLLNFRVQGKHLDNSTPRNTLNKLVPDSSLTRKFSLLPRCFLVVVRYFLQRSLLSVTFTSLIRHLSVTFSLLFVTSLLLFVTCS